MVRGEKEIVKCREMSVDIVFFFKQKTAYEIVDCDWSSDVCSSDLPAKRSSLFYMALLFLMTSIVEVIGIGIVGPFIAQIGRASCRERV